MRGQHEFYHWPITMYTGLSLVILPCDVIICGGTLIIFEIEKEKRKGMEIGIVKGKVKVNVLV